MFIERVSSTAAYGGGASAVYFGLTPGEWQVIGVLGGIVIGLMGLAVNAYFKWKHYRLAERHLSEE